MPWDLERMTLREVSEYVTQLDIWIANHPEED